MSHCIRCYISGKVQGVWYRSSTQEQAQQLNITGYARNLADGRVEVLACGDETALTQLKAWCRQGPRLAEVSDVQCENVKVDQVPSRFTTT
jgi:acylphosphatase